MNPRTRSVNFSMSIRCVPLQATGISAPRQATERLSSRRDVGNDPCRLKGNAGMRVDRLYRYPVKGLSAEALDEVRVEAGGALPWDRAFALAQGGAPFDPEHPKWLPKTNFMCLRQNARIALLKSSFDARRGRLTILAPDGSAIEENALWPAGRERIGAWLAAYLGEEARGEPRFHY